MSREENEATLRRVVVRQAVEITRVRDRLAGCGEGRNGAERGLARTQKELATVRERMAKAIAETETARREREGLASRMYEAAKLLDKGLQSGPHELPRKVRQAMAILTEGEEE